MASFSPIPPAQCCFAGSKNYRKKSQHHCSNIERGEAGGGLSSEGGQRLLAGIVALRSAGSGLQIFFDKKPLITPRVQEI